MIEEGAAAPESERTADELYRPIWISRAPSVEVESPANKQVGASPAGTGALGNPLTTLRLGPMPSYTETSPRATCKATTKAGNPCRKLAVEDGLCTFHSGKLDLAELGRRGGRARGVGKKERAGDALEGLAHQAIEKLLTGSGSATAQAAPARLVLDKIAASSPYSAELAKRAMYAEIQAERAAELPAARARLDRLIEARVTVLAEEMYEERKRLDLESVMAEMSEETPHPGGREAIPPPEMEP